MVPKDGELPNLKSQKMEPQGKSLRARFFCFWLEFCFFLEPSFFDPQLCFFMLRSRSESNYCYLSIRASRARAVVHNGSLIYNNRYALSKRARAGYLLHSKKRLPLQLLRMDGGGDPIKVPPFCLSQCPISTERDDRQRTNRSDRYGLFVRKGDFPRGGGDTSGQQNRRRAG